MTNVPPLPAGLRGAVDLSSLVQRPGAGPVDPAGAGQQGGAVAGGPAGAAPGSVAVPGLVLDATDESFAQFLEISNTVPVIVDLWAEWCGPCKQLSPVLDKLVTEYGGRLLLAKVDVDANPQLTQAFQAQSIPAVAAVIGGRPVQLFVGALPEAQVRDAFEQVLELAAQNGVTGTAVVDGAPGVDGETPEPEPEPEPLPPHHQDAYDAIDRGDYDAAITAYRTAIAQDPRDQLAVAGLAQVSLIARLQGVTLAEVREAAAADPSDLEAQLAVADLDVSGGHVEDAFDRVLTVFPTQDAAGRDAARARLLEYFEIVGVDDPRVGAARRRLTMLLY
ncbi:tetratricopeptide repeat protein [Frigoribacterium faeni]|uniref:Co-chaperone YbbN n=1 Tax=Frigoribacterium faeni TaxID=145483 RepID=A0A7W3JGJ9_9MICO|nr:tetratricopeptide repeat protein [Frigoribacterium faeni]MBA8812454.1 putative thioredoxin [Frigoribacterium faeni]BFF13535.1 tetratricopeptide repeat protein [Microbacterium flavescens]GEK81829.1 co-chaperone YbbN [Frigoribacterium faeni]